MFWGPKRLAVELEPRLGSAFVEGRIDGAAYRLSIGREIYVSPTAEAADPATASVLQLKEREAFTIPPGQLAFLAH